MVYSMSQAFLADVPRSRRASVSLRQPHSERITCTHDARIPTNSSHLNALPRASRSSLDSQACTRKLNPGVYCANPHRNPYDSVFSILMPLSVCHPQHTLYVKIRKQCHLKFTVQSMPSEYLHRQNIIRIHHQWLRPRTGAIMFFRAFYWL